MRGDLHYTLTPAGRFNIVPGQDAPVGLHRQGAREIAPLRWGLLPRWKGHGGKRGPMIHTAPVEAVPATPQLRDAFKKQRCLVLADGCYAWRELKQPVWFHPEPRRVVAFAGVWSINEDDGIASFALLTGPPLVTRVNDAMPIVMTWRAFDAWLDPKVTPERALALLAIGEPLPGWRADNVSTRMSSSQYDDASCITPLGNPNQGELF
jgi:putative SOS response-associated peptidase YedK